jgi:hypothetical protein
MIYTINNVEEDVEEEPTEDIEEENDKFDIEVTLKKII